MESLHGMALPYVDMLQTTPQRGCVPIICRSCLQACGVGMGIGMRCRRLVYEIPYQPSPPPTPPAAGPEFVVKDTLMMMKHVSIACD